MNKFSLLWKTFHCLVHKNRDLFRIRPIRFKLLHSVTVTTQIILMLYFCSELYLYMETISLPCSQKPTKKDLFRISRIQFTLLQPLPLLKLVCHRELLCTLWMYIWGSGGMAPLILIVWAGWRWVVDFTVRRLYPRGKTLWYTRIIGWLGTRLCLYKLQKRKPTWSYRESNQPAT